jgi:hypothetical protein
MSELNRRDALQRMAVFAAALPLPEAMGSLLCCDEGEDPRRASGIEQMNDSLDLMLRDENAPSRSSTRGVVVST